MIKCPMIVIGSITILILAGIVGNTLYIKHCYESIKIGMSSEEVLTIMGEPKEIIKDNNGTNINWQYYQYPIPHVFTLVIEDNVIKKKFDSISP